MATRSARSERERLRKERARAREARAAHGARVEQIKAALRPLPRERDAALRDAARNGKPGSAAGIVEQFAARERELRVELEAEVAALKAAGAAAKAAEAELVRLHADQFPEFAEAAEKLAEEAADKLAALRESYAEAYEAVEEARREWSLLVRDHNRTLLDRSDPARRASGEVRRAQLSEPPANPLSPPDAVFSGPAIRPPELEPVAEAA